METISDAESPGQAGLPDNADEETRLKFLTEGARNQEDIERDIGRHADQLLTEQAHERDQKRMDKAEREIKRSQDALSKLYARLALPAAESVKVTIRADVAKYNAKIADLEKEQDVIQKRMNDRHAVPGEDDEAEAATGSHRPLPNESRRDFLIRTGKITPFSKLAQSNIGQSGLAGTMLDAEMEELVEEASKGPTSHQNLMKPGFGSSPSSPESVASAPSPKRRKVVTGGSNVTPRATSHAPETPASDDAYTTDLSPRVVSEDLSEDSEYEEVERFRGKRKAVTGKAKKARASQPAPVEEDLAGVDDGNEKVYRTRLRKWNKDRCEARRRANAKQDEPEEVVDLTEEECYLPHPTHPDTDLGDGFRIPGDIFPALFDYQKTGVQWLYELYAQNVGGIVGDEMGLGKTIQAIAFIAGLHYSKKLTKPVIVVCPATVMKQWVNEFHRWWPALRVSILHTSGSGMLDTGREDRMEHEMELRNYGEYDETLSNSGKAAKKIVEKVKREGHVLVTTYSGLQTYAEFIIPTDWECAILDEGHKIRNPNTSITIHCKELRTPNRIILSGTPMQNNLTELWSLFDFVFPMRLGTLVKFRAQFEFPIKRGGYANASNLEFETAKQCAETLKDAVSPYLLQRFKADVAADLPQKKEQVLFCKLTRQQRDAYEKFLHSDDMSAINSGNRQMFFGIDHLQKICNHPDLVEHKKVSKDPDYGAAKKSGKMQVVKELLSLWQKGGHKTLLFAQQRIMLDILEKFIKTLPGINYRRMDGETPIKNRQSVVDEFNNDPDIHVFLLTTKVGGLGVNLTGANRVIIFDPSWNPSTDIQARERSWRLGQKRSVEIYRLMSAGTIEEKIYHRQIFKQFLTNKVLKDPGQRQTFQMSDLHDLFTLGLDRADGETDTGNLFRGSEVSFQNRPEEHSRRNSAKIEETATAIEDLAAMRGIHHAEAFKPTAEDEQEVEEGEGQGQGEKTAKSNERLLSTIFKKSGVHSVLEHDAIMNSSARGGKRKVQADPAFVQREARKTAAAAAEQLRRAEKQARRMPAGVPTWTGTFGEAGRPAPRRAPTYGGVPGGRGGRSTGGRGGANAPSSSAILNNLASRQGRANSNHVSGSSASTPVPRSRTVTPTNTRGKRMMEMIRDFFITHDNVVPSKMLVDHFDWYCRSNKVTTEEFKEILKQVATFEAAGTAGRSRWVLKDEWKRDQAARRG